MGLITYLPPFSRHLLQKKWNEPGAKLPQTIGLTASLGVGSNNDDPLNHYIMMCANLNCYRIEHVSDADNMRELLFHNPKPTQDQIKTVPPRRDDQFKAIIRGLVCIALGCGFDLKDVIGLQARGLVQCRGQKMSWL